MKIKFALPILLFLFIYNSTEINAQGLLQGTVYSAKDSTALFGASIYFDGTSLGVSTNQNGEFKLPLKNTTTSPLVISSLGYETIILNNYNAEENVLLKIYLDESTESLPEVVLEPDPWSRERKLRIFKREFLGSSMAASRCRITNPEVITLTYIPSKEVLVAEAKEPLTIINRHLGYEVTYNLTDFRVEFSTGSSGLHLAKMVYFEGLSFFKELKKSPSRKFLKNRKSAYSGSALHFMRSLAARTLTENNFRIFRKSFEVAPYEYFQLNMENGLIKVKVVESPITILYREVEQSALNAEDIFFIDALGNHTPPYGLTVSGHMGGKRAAEMVPLDYNIN
ncbi:carboxypeptidase-like regulatory domain-containing protein [Antarcticibacterium sp. 1MA-6-2]|uniref:carboxypeptidase-like regulatory domain-containing protein n=1 Tax=Antarcticibacterium sp. 1MA-6-2 TaxID=2908210 RepID=UPI001F39D755|nr:carboxypeptidase-like regulatory domain-containing protein [Antarcticibacterium sp. 1MA-6-2]UJH92607.1 carboxypeptidase-like regulatory domain-containing protein [Antarcticibacterium sp. 1MA-6-2]